MAMKAKTRTRILHKEVPQRGPVKTGIDLSQTSLNKVTVFSRKQTGFRAKHLALKGVMLYHLVLVIKPVKNCWVWLSVLDVTLSYLHSSILLPP